MTLALLSAWLARPSRRVPPGPRDLLAFSLTLLAVAWLLAASGCSLALSVTVARGDAATGGAATRAASDHWDAAVVRELGGAAGIAAGEAARRALRPPTPVPEIR